MKKLIVALLLVCLVATAIGIGTWAFFSDYETSSNNVFCAGDLDLKVDGNDTDITYFEIECMQPGDEGLVQLTLENVGCVDGVTDIHLKNLVDWENGVIEPEAEGSWYGGDNPLVGTDLPCEGASGDPDMTDGAEEGELSQYLEMRISADMDNDGTYELEVVPRGNLTDIACTNFIYGDLLAESKIGLQIEWWLPETVCNIIMTDCVTFDMEFSLNQKVGEVIGNVTGIDQSPGVVEGNPYEFDVIVHNAGTITGNFWVNVEILDENGNVVFVGKKYVENLAPCDTVAVGFSWTPPVGSSGSYRVVAGDIVCPFEVLEQGALVVTGIQQPDAVQICENLSVGIDVHNQGGSPTEGVVLATITDTSGNIMSPIFTFPTGPIAPCETIKIPWDIGHIGEEMRGAVLLVAGFDPAGADAFVCPVGVLSPAVFDITGIQGPDGAQPCEDITLGVDIHNAGDKPGECIEAVLEIRDATGATVFGPASGQIGLLAPCETIKVPFGPIHIEENWTGPLTVAAEACGDVYTKTINVVSGPVLIVTGIQQVASIPVCEELTVGVDVHNAGGKPGECTVFVTIVDPADPMTPLVGPIMAPIPALAPCETAKVAVNLGHVEESWPSTVWVGAWSCDQNPLTGFICELEIVPPPRLGDTLIPPVSNSWSYDVDFTSNDPQLPIAETDWPFDVHVVAKDVYPDNTDCRPCTDPALCPDQFVANPFPWQDFGVPPQTLSYHLSWNTNQGANIYLPPQRVMALFGNNMGMQMQNLEWWMNMDDGTEVFETDHMIPPVPGFVVDFEMANFADDYDGVQPGWPYDPIPSERWTSTWMFGGKVAAGSIFTGCVPPWPYWISCHVVGNENITVPAGNYDTVHIHCEYIYAGFDDDEDARDDDADGYVTGQELVEGFDPYDASSHPAGVPQSPTMYIDEDPLDTVDNDGDGLVDEDQPGEDSDGDGVWDEDDPFGGDGLDNDGDTYIDEDAPASGTPPANGSRDIWWSESLGVVVKQINNNTPYYGVETMELSTEPSP